MYPQMGFASTGHNDWPFQLKFKKAQYLAVWNIFPAKLCNWLAAGMEAAHVQSS